MGGRMLRRYQYFRGHRPAAPTSPFLARALPHVGLAGDLGKMQGLGIITGNIFGFCRVAAGNISRGRYLVAKVGLALPRVPNANVI
jgi:hypothetical protein